MSVGDKKVAPDTVGRQRGYYQQSVEVSSEKDPSRPNSAQPYI